MDISFQVGSLPYIRIESEKIFPAAFLKYQAQKINIKNDRIISIKETSIKTNLADITGAEVRGNRDSIFIVMESGFPRAKKLIATGIAGTIINDPRAEVFGSFIVAAIAEKKVFQKKKPATENKNKPINNSGFVNTNGSDQPLPNSEDTNTNTTEVKEYVTNKANDNKEIPRIFPSIHVCGLIAETITSVILSCFSPVIATN